MEFIKIGNIANVHGIKGELSIYPYTDDIDNFCKYSTLYIGERKEKFKVIKLRPHKNMVLAMLESINDVNIALKYKTYDVYIDKNDLQELDDDSYYIEDLIGIKVISNTDNEELGIIKNVIKYPSNDVYEVTSEKETFYIPAIKSVIKKIDLINKEMYIEMMEGLK